MNANIHVAWSLYLNEFTRLSEDEKLSWLKRDFNSLKPAQCGYYAAMLDRYIQQVGINYIPFVYKFNENDVRTMKTILQPDRCPGNAYQVVVHWLDALLYLNDFAKLSDNEKLNQLKRDLYNVNLINCWVYAEMLNRYIQKVGTNYTAFLSNLTLTEIQIIIQNLHACPNNEYSTIINWLINVSHNQSSPRQSSHNRSSPRQSSPRRQSPPRQSPPRQSPPRQSSPRQSSPPNHSSSLNKFLQQSEYGQVKFLKDNLTVITPENCTEYAEYLSAYVNQYGKTAGKEDYVSRVFKDMFNRRDIAKLLVSVHPDKCITNKKDRTTINWLQTAKQQSMS